MALFSRRHGVPAGDTSTEQKRSATDEQRVDPQAQLVEQAVVEKSLAERAVAVITRSPLPCFLSSRTATAASPRTMVAFVQVASSSVVENTYFVISFIRSA
jgi:hypothetical protein